MTFWKWSRTAATNATADSTINWAEGQAPSTINDSARAVMAAAAKYRDDVAGAIFTAGVVNAYTIGSYQGFDTLAHLDGNLIAFTPHVTNTSAVTLNVDGLGAKPIRSGALGALIGGELIAGTPYVALYNNAANSFFLKGFIADPYSIPLGGGIDYWGFVAPNSAFAFPAGQAISRATYAGLFALIGTTYGVGDGSTTFNLPDKVGRVSAMLDAGSSRISATWFGGNPANLGASGGSEKSALASTNQLPQFTPSGTIANGAISFPSTPDTSASGGGLGGITTGPGGVAANLTSLLNPSQGTSTFTGNAIGSGSPLSFRTCQPTIVCNYIIRVL